jgi:hypothetical protein
MVFDGGEDFTRLGGPDEGFRGAIVLLDIVNGELSPPYTRCPGVEHPSRDEIQRR